MTATGCRAGGRDGRAASALCAAIRVDACYCPFVGTCRMAEPRVTPMGTVDSGGPVGSVQFILGTNVPPGRGCQ